MISKEQIRQIIEVADIIRIIGGYVPSLKSSGTGYTGLCPFHQEKTPSFTVSATRNKYHCFGCGADGDVIGFLMNVENYSFLEAANKLAEQYGIAIHQSQPSPNLGLENGIYACMQAAVNFYTECLKHSGVTNSVMVYKKSRNFTEDTCKIFELGYAPEGWNNLYRRLKKENYGETVQENAGLIKKNKKKINEYYDFFRDRLIFPMRDPIGRCIGFSGRTLDDSGAKYINSPETKIYKKSKVLYGHFQAKEAIRQKRQIILVEGYFDVMRMYENGFQETVSPCGTALTQEHLDVIKRQHAEKIFILFDGDSAGVNASLKTAKLCVQEQVDAYVAQLPTGTDPDDYLQSHNESDMQRILESSLDVASFIVQKAYKDSREFSLEIRSQVLEELVSFGDLMESNIRKRLWIKKIASIFDYQEEDLQKSFKKKQPHQVEELKGKLSFQQQSFEFSEQQYAREFELIRRLLFFREYIALALRYIKPDYFECSVLRQFFIHIGNLDEQERLISHQVDYADVFPEFSHLIHYLHETVPNKYKYNALQEEHSDRESSKRDMENYIYRFLQNKRNRRLNEVLSTEEQRRLLLNYRSDLKAISGFNHFEAEYAKHRIKP